MNMKQEWRQLVGKARRAFQRLVRTIEQALRDLVNAFKQVVLRLNRRAVHQVRQKVEQDVWAQIEQLIRQPIRQRVVEQVCQEVRGPVWGELEQPLRELAWWQVGWQVKQGLESPTEFQVRLVDWGV